MGQRAARRGPTSRRTGGRASRRSRQRPLGRMLLTGFVLAALTLGGAAALVRWQDSTEPAGESSAEAGAGGAAGPTL